MRALIRQAPAAPARATAARLSGEMPPMAYTGMDTAFTTFSSQGPGGFLGGMDGHPQQGHPIPDGGVLLQLPQGQVEPRRPQPGAHLGKMVEHRPIPGLGQHLPGQGLIFLLRQVLFP